MTSTVERGREQGRLVLEVCINRHLRHGCAFRDHLHGGRRDATLKEQGIGRIQNGLKLGEITGPAGAPAFAFDRHHLLVIIDYWTYKSTN